MTFAKRPLSGAPFLATPAERVLYGGGEPSQGEPCQIPPAAQLALLRQFISGRACAPTLDIEGTA